MPHEIDRVLTAAAEGVWLIDEGKGKQLASLLALRAQGLTQSDMAETPKPSYAMDPLRTDDGFIHVLRLQGAIMPRANMMTRMSGGATLEQFQQAFKVAAADKSAKAIVIDTDSPGGLVDLVQETAEMIYRARRPDRPIISVANTLAASAAYWISSAADEVVVAPSGKVGSIGVYMMYTDVSEALKMAGLKREVIKAGPRKAEGASGSLDESARKHLQQQADATYDEFVSAVARQRSVAKTVVRADPDSSDEHFGGGRAYHAKQAVRLGMADRIATLEDTINDLVKPRRSSRASLARRRLMMT